MKGVRTTRVGGALLLAGVVALLAARVPALVDEYLGMAEVDRVPTFEARPGSHEIVVAAGGELSGVQTSWLRVPRVETGMLRIAWLAPNGALLEEGEPVVRFDDSDARLLLVDSSSELEAYDHRMSKADADAQGQQAVNSIDLRGADLELDFSQRQVREDERIFSQLEIRESLVSAALARYRKDFVQDRGRLQERLSQSDRELLSIQSGEVRRDVEQARETLNSLTLRMEKTGVVLHPSRSFNPLQPGLEVYPNARLLEVASLKDYRGMIWVAEKEAAMVKVGQRVRVAVPALSSEPIAGTISEVGLVARQTSYQDPRQYFDCSITLEVGPERMAQLRPGMRLTAEVLVETLSEAFVVPKSAVHRSDQGEPFVFVESPAGSREGTGFQQHPIRIRGSDHAFFAVEGLAAGARLALRHPERDKDTYLPDFNAQPAASTRRFIVFD